MKNLGKMLLLLTFLTTTLLASVEAKLNPRVAYEGDMVRFSLVIEGSKIQKPRISQLCGENVLATSSATNIEMINGDYSKKYIFSYDFIARKSCTIESIAVMVDDKVEKSNPIKLIVKKASEAKNRDFILEYETDKTELFVGESFELTLRLKQNMGASVIDSKFVPSDFKGFWKKKELKPKRYEEGEYIVTEVKYVLAPQREGNLTIKPAQIQVASRVAQRGGWGGLTLPGQVQWKSYFSNEVHLHVKPLPGGVHLIGNFKIFASADKTVIHSGEAVNVEVRVQGDGNLEDIESLKPYIDDANVFEEKPSLKGDIFRQKFAIVADKDFTIPSFSIKFFNPSDKKIETVQTKPIHVKVLSSAAQKNETLVMKKDASVSNQPLTKQGDNTVVTTQTKANWWLVAAAFLLGLGAGAVLMLYAGKKEFFTTQKRVRFNPKDKKLLLVKLLPYKESDSDVAKIIEILEKNIDENATQSVDKKLLKEVLKRYDIS